MSLSISSRIQPGMKNRLNQTYHYNIMIASKHIAKDTGDNCNDVYKALINCDMDTIDWKTNGEAYKKSREYISDLKCCKGVKYHTIVSRPNPSREGGACYINAYEEYALPNTKRLIVGMELSYVSPSCGFLTPHAYNADKNNQRYDTHSSNRPDKVRSAYDILSTDLTPKEITLFYKQFAEGFKISPINRWGAYAFYNYKNKVYINIRFSDKTEDYTAETNESWISIDTNSPP
jgi:hypothetical protein